MKFAKIIELPNDVQVVVMKGCRNSKDLFPLEISTAFPSIVVTVTTECTRKSELDRVFEEYDVEGATKFRQNMEKMLDHYDDSKSEGE